MVNEDGSLVQNPNAMENDGTSDFTADDLVLLKEMLLSLEKAVDEITLPNLTMGGETFTGGYIFSLLEKANVRGLSKNKLSKSEDNFQPIFRSHNVMLKF